VSPERAAQLAAIEPDWRPEWPVNWQRHYAGVRGLVDAGTPVGDIKPGTTVHGADLGRWVARQRSGWAKLSEEQRDRLEQLGIKALTAPEAEPEQRPAPQASGAHRRLGTGPRRRPPVPRARRTFDRRAISHRDRAGRRRPGARRTTGRVFEQQP
jgi:hypothetical protein